MSFANITNNIRNAAQALLNGEEPDDSYPGAASRKLPQWNHGLFAQDLVFNNIFPRDVPTDGKTMKSPRDNPGTIRSGTHHGTRIAMTEMLQRIEQRFQSYFDVANFDANIPQDRDFVAQRLLYTWQEPGTTSPSYPPCLAMVPPQDKTGLLQIFNAMRLLDTGMTLQRIIPPVIDDWVYGTPEARTMAGCERANAKLRTQDKNIGQEANIADREDWYTDAAFAQQSFTGPNPSSITAASADWVEKFMKTADVQGLKEMHNLLQNARNTLYIQDNSYFREAVGANDQAELKSDDGRRFGCAAVTLFQLNQDGRLHPLSIVLDYRGSMEKSVVIFNKRLSASDSSRMEGEDWPWRYAKMCSQVSDWTRHEIDSHLTACHFVEEATIVAGYRSFDQSHVIYKLLEPHWLKTLSLNASARSALVPNIVTKINGFTEAQTYAFIQDAYNKFDWESKYIPNDLKSRGFDMAKLNDNMFRNYAYAKNMSLMWPALHEFVKAVLVTNYKTDMDVKNDKSVQTWCTEMRSPAGGRMASFPVIKTIEALTNAVVMCIHIASPQHNAVNYLQCYYMSFVPNKPASLMAPLPQTIEQLRAYKENDMMASLPINNSQVWLMSSQLPYLLSYRVAEDQTLLNYAASLQQLASQKTGKEWQAVSAAAMNFHAKLLELRTKFRKNSDAMDKDIVPYHVMDPTEMAVSVLI
ncbi:hypothetical protein BP6252_09476 [Coleophoma cylindrospora]|uniref:Manganese lipoxygenase n=1 Tax=Coleophoma cylindrospora TaxID=1849047 RepID=A0A3D8R2A9_9HELO|nr:hypothetical protein BP6252_09476 [Coleophoma cylindrospora]